ncbi:hypothetical protein B566_EDAN002665 [Ephemera danica]|nr:hypothetical protein B566_EDAN002665 [Ephemera danica]
MSGNESDDEPQLSATTLAALQEFYVEEEERNNKLKNILNSASDDIPRFQENWQLSQFWYDEETTNKLSEEILRATVENGKIALISCPTLYKRIKSTSTGHTGRFNKQKMCLFEFDERFAAYGNDFCFYDYQCPLQIPKTFAGNFDVVVADPPFLSEECLTKTAITIKFLAKEKVLLCTGELMDDLAHRLLQVSKTPFQPKHSNNLGNEFRCYANYSTSF